MFNPTELMIHTFAEQLQTGYRDIYGSLQPHYSELLGWVVNVALEKIAASDAPYHNVEHTILVTLVGQEILRGKHIREGNVSCHDWVHCIISLLCHDIGYVKGVCHQDQMSERLYVTGPSGEMVVLEPGTTDASLTPYHVDRGKLFVEQHFGSHKLIDIECIQRNIELTRFPVPADAEHQATANYPGLIRAADLIGQLSDPRYLQKLPALFYELEETGVSRHLGYRHPQDLRSGYPHFYRSVVYPYICDGLSYLEATQQGKQIIANLYANVFIVEHELLKTTRVSSPASVEPDALDLKFTNGKRITLINDPSMADDPEQPFPNHPNGNSAGSGLAASWKCAPGSSDCTNLKPEPMNQHNDQRVFSFV